MAKIAVLGLGAMGVRMARRLVSAGNEVVVWNRTAPAADFVPGAAIASSPREAARGTDAVIAMVRDDVASRAVWLDPEHGALAGLPAHALAIESSTLTPEWARAWARAVGEAEGVAVEAPVSGSRPQAESGQLICFLGGDAPGIARAQPLLAPLGQTFHHVGPVGAAAVVKLVTNTLLALQVGAWSEVLPLMQREGLDVEAAIKALSTTTPFPPIAGYILSLMRAGNHAPQFPVELIAKDMAYVSGIGAPGDLPLAETMERRFGAAIEAGLGGENMTALIKLSRS